MRAIIFDIDGTLIDSMAVEPDLYFSAINAVLGPVKIRPNLEDYYNVTDSGIVTEVMNDNGLSEGTNAQNQIQMLFVNKLRDFISRNGPFPEITGAIQLFNRARLSADTQVAIATGSWRRSACLKLESSGFGISGIPLASCDISPSRIEIMTSVLSSLGKDFESVTYFGDGEWDQRACEELGWDFIAVGPNLGGIQSYEGFEI